MRNVAVIERCRNDRPKMLKCGFDKLNHRLLLSHAVDSVVGDFLDFCVLEIYDFRLFVRDD